MFKKYSGIDANRKCPSKVSVHDKIATRLTRNLRIPPGRVEVFAASEASLKCFFADPGAALLGLTEVSFEAVSSSGRDFAVGLQEGFQAQEG